MSEKPWYSFLTEPPDASASGCVEALFVDEQDEPQMAVLHLHHYVEKGSRWGHNTPHPTQPYRWITHHPEYIRWRYRGPVVPTPEEQGTASLVWRFRDAPGELAALSDHGGDEDWVILMPEGENHPWMFDGSRVLGESFSRYPLPDGRLVTIYAHA
jgi:hypothetical protein